ncbi:MAG: DUF4296 domain-containing protein [Catalinimonas sp.]
MNRLRAVVLCVLCAACAPDNNPPDDLIPSEEMVDLLVEIHLAEGKASTARLRADSAALFFRYLQQQTLEARGIDTARYRRSYDYYVQQVEQLDDIYAAVVDSLGVIQSRGGTVVDPMSTDKQP